MECYVNGGKPSDASIAADGCQETPSEDAHDAQGADTAGCGPEREAEPDCIAAIRAKYEAGPRRYKGVRMIFQDEAGFGRITTPSYCWCERGMRPSVPCHRIREYVYAYGGVDPVSGDSFFLILPKCNTEMMNLYLKGLSERFSDDLLLVCCDGASWHKSKGMEVPENIVLFFIPPYTPEMNPIEQIWKELRSRGFKNVLFKTLKKVEDKLVEVIQDLKNTTVKSITCRDWILKCFN